MKEITYFYLKSCPYCKQANSMLDKLRQENPLYSKIKINAIEERQQADIANQFDYFYVPCFYVDGKKVHEGAASTQSIQSVLDTALKN